MKLLRNTLGALSLALLSSSTAYAAQELVLLTDQTQLLSISGNAGTVVIGNPSIADATIHGSKIFVHGRGYGTTNLVILDQNGNQLSTFDITVQSGGDNNVAIYKAGARQSYVCMPNCEATVQVGDEAAWTDQIIQLNEKRTSWATGTGGSSQTAPAQAPAQ
jgi:Flp pilus assembly secretin CpaC